MRHPFAILAFLAAGLISPPAHAADQKPVAPPGDGLYAQFDTPRGMIVAELFFMRAPLTVTNFVGLAEGTLGPEPRRPFYDGLTFHRVVPGFVVQGGDPLATGEGGPGYEFPDEFAPGLGHDGAGTLSMANGGPHTNGSQFFITLDRTSRLNGVHSVFGRVVRGLNLVHRIQAGDTIDRVTIHRIGPAAESFRADPARFPALVENAQKPRPPLFDDPGRLLPNSARDAQAYEKQLAKFERATGIPIHVRVAQQLAPETPSQRPGARAGALARGLALTPNAVLAVYFADIDDWGLWIGDYHLPRLMGRAGTVDEFTRGGALHDAKQALLTTSRTQADAAAKKSSAATPLAAADKIKLQVDAVIEALTVRLKPVR
jgi:cyclophilin family peptidyl-prolyl cis-trans isomerase